VQDVTGRFKLRRPVLVVIDCGNGAGSLAATRMLKQIGAKVEALFCDSDGTFPNHHPDPTVDENLSDLIDRVRASGAELGIAFDGDADRIGAVDEEGNIVRGDYLLLIYALDALKKRPGEQVIFDVKCSEVLEDSISRAGGRPIMWKSGHSRMRAKMLESGALLGGEFSGHLFIKERWFGFDDAVYAAARVLELLALEPRPASELFAELPSSPSTPEYHLVLEEGQSRELMRALDAHKVFDDARLVELDGLRVEFADGWGLIRPSNTTPALAFRFEADDAGALEEIKSRFRHVLRRLAPGMQAPF